MVSRVVLVVEDEEPIRRIVMQSFRRDERLAAAAYVACATYEGAVAVYEELVRDSTVRVATLVTDYNLDVGHTGDEVITALVERGFTGPVIMMSGRLEDGVREVAGLTVTVKKKPFRMDELCDAVAALIRPPGTE